MLAFPVFGYAASASNQSTPPPTQKVIIASLKDIYTRLNDLSNRTQLAINQLSTNGITTDQAELDLIDANTALGKAKTAIDKLQPMANADAFKVTVTSIEDNLKAGKDNILTTLTVLKSALPGLDNDNK